MTTTSKTIGETADELNAYQNRLADLVLRCQLEGAGLHWSELIEADQLCKATFRARYGRPAAYSPMPNDGEVNPTLGLSRQDPGAMSNGLSGLKHRAGDISEVT